MSRISTTFRPGIAARITDGMTALAAAHWLAQPVMVLHCGMEPQFGIEFWHGQLVEPSSIICEVMVHNFAIATLTTGTNARVNESRNATMVRVQVMGLSSHTIM